MLIFGYFFVIYIIDYSVKVPFLQDKYFSIFLRVSRFRLFSMYILLRLKCLPTKRIKTNRDLANAGTSAFPSTHIPTALPVGNLARVMTPVSLSIIPAIYVVLLQMSKISQRKRYIKKQKCLTVTSKDDELDLQGDDVDSFTGSNADLESAADNLFTSPPRPQPLPFSSLSLKTPVTTHLQIFT